MVQRPVNLGGNAYYTGSSVQAFCSLENVMEFEFLFFPDLSWVNPNLVIEFCCLLGAETFSICYLYSD